MFFVVDPHGIHHIDVVLVVWKSNSGLAITELQLPCLLQTISLDFFLCRFDDSGYGFWLAIGTLPDSLEVGELRYLRADGLEIAEGSLKDTARRAGATKHLVHKTPKGNEISEIRRSCLQEGGWGGCVRRGVVRGNRSKG